MESAQLRAVVRPRSRCFVEDDRNASLVRRSLAEGVGTMMLMIAVVGSSLRQEASPLSSSIAVGCGLIGLLLAFGAASGGHFNPTITLMQWLLGQRRLDCAFWYVSAQTIGGLIGSFVSQSMFATPPKLPTLDLPSASSLVSEGVASFALMTVVFCCMQSTNKVVGPFAVGLWLVAAIVSTPTGSIANPAVAIGLLATSQGGSLLALPLFLFVQLGGGGLATRIVAFIYPEDVLLES